MTRVGTRERAAFVLLFAMVVPFWTSASPDAPKRVLIVHSFARDAAPYASVATTFRSELTRQLAAPLIFDEIDLHADRRDAEDSQAVIAFLNARFANQPPDVIVALGPPAAQFFTTHRDRVVPIGTSAAGGRRAHRCASSSRVRTTSSCSRKLRSTSSSKGRCVCGPTPSASPSFSAQRLSTNTGPARCSASSNSMRVDWISFGCMDNRSTRSCGRLRHCR